MSKTTYFMSKIDEGSVFHRTSEMACPVLSGPRTALTENGDLVCTFMAQSALGINDFIPMVTQSIDRGKSWSKPIAIWPHLSAKYSIFGSISRASNRLLFYGTRTPIDAPGESFWSDATQGLKANELFFSESVDNGRTWQDPNVIPMAIVCAAEAPGAICESRNKNLMCCYAPYNTFDNTTVDKHQVVAMVSKDNGATWFSRSMIRFVSPDSSAAEAWLIELSDGRLLGASWHFNRISGENYNNTYAISEDEGLTWSKTHTAPLNGQSLAMVAKPNGGVLIVYNQRKNVPYGVRLAVAEIDSAGMLQILSDDMVWQANAPTSNGLDPKHCNWTSFAFGEPSITFVSEDVLFIAFWCREPNGTGMIRYVRYQLS